MDDLARVLLEKLDYLSDGQSLGHRAATLVAAHATLVVLAEHALKRPGFAMDPAALAQVLEAHIDMLRPGRTVS